LRAVGIEGNVSQWSRVTDRRGDLAELVQSRIQAIESWIENAMILPMGPSQQGEITFQVVFPVFVHLIHNQLAFD